MAVDSATWKLSEFLLAEKELFPIFLLSCAVRSGGGEFKVIRQNGLRRDHFFFSGEAWSLEELKSLGMPGGVANVKGRVRDLGTALNVAASLGRVEFCSYRETSGLELHISTDKTATLTRRDLEEARSGQRFTVTYRHSPIALDELEKLGRFAPLQFTVDNRQLREMVDFRMEEGGLFGHLLVEGRGPLLVRSTRYANRKVASFKREDDSSGTMALALCDPDFAEEHQWKLIGNGILFEELPLKDDDPPFLCGIVDISNLKTDISGRKLIQNEEYEAVLRQLEEAKEELILKFCEDPVRLSERELLLFQEELYRRYGRREMPLPVTSFLLRTMKVDPGEPESLRELGKSGTTPTGWQVVCGFLEDFRRRASLAYGRNDFHQTARWLHNERTVVTHAQRPTEEIDRILYFLSLLHPSFNWRRTKVEPSVRTVLAHLGDKEATAASVELKGWGQPIRLFAGETPQSERDSHNWVQAFAIWEHCEESRFSEVEAILEEMATGENRLTEARVWKLVVLRLYRGRMSFLESVRWSVAHNYCQHFSTTPAQTRAFRLLPSSPETWDATPLLLEKRISSTWLPLVMSRLMAYSRYRDRTEALSFLGHVLLQASLLREGLLHCQDLPPWDEAFPVHKLTH